MRPYVDMGGVKIAPFRRRDAALEKTRRNRPDLIEEPAGDG